MGTDVRPYVRKSKEEEEAEPQPDPHEEEQEPRLDGAPNEDWVHDYVRLLLDVCPWAIDIIYFEPDDIVLPSRRLILFGALD